MIKSGAYPVRPRQQEMEESNHCALKFSASGTCDCVWAECLPNDALTDVGGDEEGDARAQAISLLEQLIQTDDNDASKEQLHHA